MWWHNIKKEFSQRYRDSQKLLSTSRPFVSPSPPFHSKWQSVSLWDIYSSSFFPGSYSLWRENKEWTDSPRLCSPLPGFYSVFFSCLPYEVHFVRCNYCYFYLRQNRETAKTGQVLLLPQRDLEEGTNLSRYVPSRVSLLPWWGPSNTLLSPSWVLFGSFNSIFKAGQGGTTISI